MPERNFFLKPRPPMRAFVAAAILGVVGAILTTMAFQYSWHVLLIVLSILVLSLGVGLFAAALVAMARLGVRVTLDDEGYRISGTGQEHEGRWADVSKVTQAVHGAHVTIYHGNVRRTHLIFPGGPAEEQMPEVIEAIMERLERAKA